MRAIFVCMSQLEKGCAIIRSAAQSLPQTPGVYRMLGEDGSALYIGKARRLAARVASYAHRERLPLRLQRMVAAVASVEVVHTRTEVEALVLEANFIKKEKPRYNILLKDDKSFPYILLRGDHLFAQLVKHRGARDTPGYYYGPFPSAGDVNKTLTALQRAFMLRSCTDSVFAARTRPCLQYHIGRCTAPCVKYVDKAAYAAQVAQAQAFLEGRSQQVQETLTQEMEAASVRLDYETAARYRDRLRALSTIGMRQDVDIEGLGDADAVAVTQDDTRSCINVVFVRGGVVLGAKAFFPRQTEGQEAGAIVAAFLTQFYTQRPAPPHILIPCAVEDRAVLEEALSVRGGGAVTLHIPQKGAKRRLMDFATLGAQRALARESAERGADTQGLAALTSFMGIEGVLERIEVYDNAHTAGREAVGGMVVAGPKGFIRKAYRLFRLRETAPSDDYGAMREVLSRRLKGGVDLPNLIIVDGGAGQLSVALQVVGSLEIPVLAVAKGPERNAGRERLFVQGKECVALEHDDPLLYYIQRLRDEAHRFANGAHKAQRTKRMTQSVLDDISGIGPLRKKALLHHFGSTKAVLRATADEMAKVPGFSLSLAQKVEAALRG